MPDRRAVQARLASLVAQVGDRLTDPAAATGAPAGPATPADVRAAYRLLLGREPDPSGAALYAERLRSGLAVGDLAAELLSSPEFATRWKHLVVTTKPAVTEVAVDGFTIAVEAHDWAVGATIARDRDYEPDVSAQLRSLLANGATFVDVGANIGWHALLGAAAVGPTGRVIAVEPNPANGRLLERSRALNGFEQLDVVVGAAADETGWLALRTDGSNGAAVPLRPITAATRAEPCSYAVPAFRLDDLLEGKGVLDDVTVLKIDVEGLETRVLRGAPRLLEVRPTIVFEWFPQLLRDDGEQPAAPLHLLRDLGYRIGVVGHPSADDGSGLDDDDVEKVRLDSGRQMLDLVAVGR